MSKSVHDAPDIETLFYGRFYNANPPPPHPRPPPPERFLLTASEHPEDGRRTAPPGYQWVLVKIEDVDQS